MRFSTTKLSKKRSRVAHSAGSSSTSLYGRLRGAVRGGNYNEAICLLNRLIAHEPDVAVHYRNRGLVYSRCCQWAQAMSDYGQALRLNPDCDLIYTQRAKCHIAQGNWDDAIADYDCAIDINPYNIRARLHQGILFRDLSLYEDAIICFGLALFLGELDAHIYLQRGRTYHLDGHWNCAMGDYQRALTLLKDDSHPFLEIAIRTWSYELLLPSQ